MITLRETCKAPAPEPEVCPRFSKLPETELMHISLDVHEGKYKLPNIIQDPADNEIQLILPGDTRLVFVDV